MLFKKKTDNENIRTENVKPKSNLRSNESVERNSERKPDYLDRLERLEDEEQFELDSMMTVWRQKHALIAPNLVFQRVKFDTNTACKAAYPIELISFRRPEKENEFEFERWRQRRVQYQL